MTVYVFDCEGDSLKPTRFHCLSYSKLGDKGFGKVKTLINHKLMKKFLTQKGATLIGHNIARWDIPELERVLEIEVTAKIIDTLAFSWYLFPTRNQHGLEWWGEDFGVPKPKISSWTDLTLEEYVHRCEEDVKINILLWKKQEKFLKKLYQDDKDLNRFISYIMFKMKCAQMQEKSRWKLDKDRCITTLNKLEAEADVKIQALIKGMPKVPTKTKYHKPTKPFKMSGELSAAGARWFARLRKLGLPEDYPGPVDEVTGQEDANPNSHHQIKKWLFDLGWVPANFKYEREDNGQFRKIPQIRVEEDDSKVLCPSVLKLIPRAPAIEHLAGLTVLQHRIGILNGFLENEENGYVQARVQGLTNTLRFKHTEVVNLPGVSKPYGEDVRGCLVAPEGYELCGSDMASLEDRTKQHYMWNHDPEYVKQMNTEGFDPHLDIALLAKMMTEEEVDAYKGGDKSKHSVRHDAKQVNYSCTYGVTPEGIVRNNGMALSRARTLHATFWKRNWSLNAIADECIIKTVNGQRWLFNPVSKFWYSLRADKDKFSTLNQGTGVFCFDMWVREILLERPQLTAQFHDEVVLCVRKGNRKRAVDLLKTAIRRVNEKLKLNRELDVDVEFGENYAEIH